MHDVVQVAARLPRQAVLVGHGAGALVVAGRWPATRRGPACWSRRSSAAGRTLVAALRRNPFGTLPALFGGRLRLSRASAVQRRTAGRGRRGGYLARIGGRGGRAQWQLLRARPAPSRRSATRRCWWSAARRPGGAAASLDRTAARYGGAPLLFPGMGHDLMLDAGWAEPIDAILDWLDKQPPRG